MKDHELQKAAADRSLPKPLRDHLVKTLGEQLDLQTREQRHLGWAMLAGMVLLILMTAATGTIAILGSIDKIKVVDRYFTPLWTTFGVGFVGTIGTNIAARLRRG
jgi:hypothetical protein